MNILDFHLQRCRGIEHPNSQMSINIPREVSVICFLINYLELDLQVIEKADNSRYAKDVVERLVNLGPIALLSNFELTTSSGKHSEEVNHTHLVS